MTTVLVTGANRGIGLEICRRFAAGGDEVVAVCRKASPELEGCLGQGAKVAIITSRMGSIEDNTSGGRYGYRMSKAAVNMAGIEPPTTWSEVTRSIERGYPIAGTSRARAALPAPEAWAPRRPHRSRGRRSQS